MCVCVPVQGAFIIGSYIAFEVTEAIHWSGIIASLFCGFAMRHYAIKNIAEQYQPMVIDMVHMLALMADLCIFFSVGTNIVLQVRSTPFLRHFMYTASQPFAKTGSGQT